jgi:hypothetical protein
MRAHAIHFSALHAIARCTMFYIRIHIDVLTAGLVAKSFFPWIPLRTHARHTNCLCDVETGLIETYQFFNKELPILPII